MSHELPVVLKTLTPLWTGGVDGTMDRVHETGILGSLRWWYEAIVRGLGGWACDPTSDGRCPDRDGKYCDVCQVFGATGWRRRFRLEVADDTKAIWTPSDKMLNIRPPGRSRGWFLPPGRMGTLTLHLDGDKKTLSLLAALFLFLEQRGSIGAKPQLGYGVFKIENRDEVRSWTIGQGREKPGWEWKMLGNKAAGDNLPDLRRFGFLRYRFSPERPGWWTWVPGMERVASQVQPLVSTYRTVPVVPSLKNEWRFRRWEGSRQDEQTIFGTLRPKRRRGRIAISWAYPADQGWEVRGWVWLSTKRWADNIWGLVKEHEGWEAALRVQGELKAHRIDTKEQVLNLLEATK